MMNITIKISGSGTPLQVADQLTQISHHIARGNYVNALLMSGKCTWEDATLITEIKEENDEEA